MARPPAQISDHPDSRLGSATTSAAGAGLGQDALAEVLSEQFDEVLGAWVQAQRAAAPAGRRDAEAAALRAGSAPLLSALLRAAQRGGVGDPGNHDYAEVVRLLHAMSKDRARQGWTPTETAVGVFRLKEALTSALERSRRDRPLELAAELTAVNRLVDGLGLLSFEAYVAGREEVINGQQRSLLELSTPVVKLWDGIVALPLIGTLDSGRTQTVMENLLQAIVDTGSQVAIIDITGVSVVDTLVAQHLLKTVAATRLMGADCVISGIRPQIAQTMVHLGVDLGQVVTKATLADAFRHALRRIGTNPATVVAR